MEVQYGPNSVDEPNLLYKLQKKIKVFDTSNTLPNRGYNLVASSNKYGLVFVASPNNILCAYLLKQLIDKEAEAQYFPVKLPESPTHIAVSCDQELLVVTGGQIFNFYKVPDFQNQNVSPCVVLKSEVGPTFVSSLQWNPCIPDSIAVAFYDGKLLAYDVNTAQVKKVQAKCRTLCWSPRGKQFVTGNNDGTLTQYKPDLTPVKMVPAPNLFEGSPVEALAVYWIATFQFAVVYKNASDNSRPTVAIVNTPKGAQIACLNYEDVCYSMESSRPWYYYLQGLAQWNIILSSSSNSMEIATLGSADGATWKQWCQTDEARPELPLTNKKQENYPIGLCIDTCAVHQLPWGENETLPPMPTLLVLSHTGVLTLFNIINLNKEAPQICSPPQTFALPLAALTAVIPSDIQTQPKPQVQQPIAPKPQPAVQPSQPPPVYEAPKNLGPQLGAFGSINPLPQTQPPSSVQQNIPAINADIPLPPKSSHQKPTENKQITPNQPQAPQTTASEQKTSQPTSAQTQLMQETYAAMKAEQERIKVAKTNQELRNMIVKEVNDFQMELYKFTVTTKQAQVKIQRDIDTINSSGEFKVTDAEKLKKDCSLDDLRNSIVQLKLELVRACAVVADARTHAEAKDLQQWTQADPLTTKRVASIKKLAYYVQNQIDHAMKSLDFKWNEHEAKEQERYKPGPPMIRPVLDDVYQPLVKQQEILCRQQTVLKTLKNVMKEVNTTPLFKSTSLLRSTPFKTKDPLKNLTKNILNMSIEPKSEPKVPLLSAQKLDALRDMLSNHKTVKIKPINVELRQQLAAMKINYENSLKEKAKINIAPDVVQAETVEKIPLPTTKQIAPPAPASVIPLKQEMFSPSPIKVPSFTPAQVNVKPSVPGLTNVARTLFTDGSKPEITRPLSQSQSSEKTSGFLNIKQEVSVPTPAQPFSFSGTSTAAPSTNTISVLKDLLQTKQANITVPKNDANTFMGQKICSPTAFSTTKPVAPTFTAKPISDINNLFNKFLPQTVPAESKTSTNVQTPETTENKFAAISTQENKKDEKSTSNIFGTKSFVSLTTNKQNLESKTADTFTGEKKAPIKILPKAAEPPKEDASETKPEIISPIPVKIDQKEVEAKPFSFQSNSSLNILSIPLPPSENTPETTKLETKKEVDQKKKPDIQPKEDAKDNSSSPTSSTASSLFAAAHASSTNVSKPQTVFSASSPFKVHSDTNESIRTVATTTSESKIKPSLFTSTSSTSASSIFGAAVASQPTTTTQSGSLFGSPPSSSSSSYSSSSSGSLFQSTTSSPIFGTSTTASVFSSDNKSVEPSTTQATATPSGVFASTTTTSSVFTSSLFSTSSAPSSVFGQSQSTTRNASIFGAPTKSQSVFATATTQASSIFGSPTSSASSVFGTETATTQASVFSAPTSQSSVFGQQPTSQSSIFGSSTQTSVFGSPTSTASVFGSPTQTTQSSSVFGSTPATTAQSGSLFGGADLFASASISTTTAQAQSSGGNIFGSSSGSVFGKTDGNTNVFGAKSTFGQPNATTTSIFGGGASFGEKQANNFWTAGNNANGSSGFGQPSTTQASSIFGGGSSGSFSSPAPNATPFGSPQNTFGGTENKPSVFGSPQQQNTSAFGGSPAFGAKPVFGQSSNFGTPPSSGFGSFGGFNKSPTTGFGASATFGGGAAFGAPAFGNTSPGKVFGSSSPGFGQATQSNAMFESLATQNTLTFGNLAQQSVQPQPAPSFNTSPSFTGWRG